MAEQTPQKSGTAEGKRKMSLAEKIIRIVFKIVLGIILLIAVAALLILTPPVQNFIKNKATTWL
ncbi:MAG: hypothetical protein J7497_07005, partial [Chitinophagaceae bacterium]|nr:hypothetical protein [Chitinophagaceae bacterium]